MANQRTMQSGLTIHATILVLALIVLGGGKLACAQGVATGGTAEASLQLIRRAGASVVGVAVLLELGFLGGRKRLAPALGGASLDALVAI